MAKQKEEVKRGRNSSYIYSEQKWPKANVEKGTKWKIKCYY